MTIASTAIEPAAASHAEQLQRLQGEVEALREQLRRAQRLAAMGTMTAMVAHEFNNILTPIINYAQLAQKNPALSGKAISRAADGGQRATQICKAILDMSRDGLKELQEVDLVELVDQTLSAMARDPRKDGIELLIEAPKTLTIHTRRVEIQQVLLNLLLNARAALLAGTGPKRIGIRLARQASGVSIEVSDTGVGIAPENLQRIFEPFFTTKDSDQDAAKGHGLGLAICKDIIQTLGGQISVQSKPGQGATFSVILPAADVD